jgi:hypothetical protein
MVVTPCFGTCPVFRVTLRSDGRADYHGDSYVATPGDRHARFAPARWSAIERALGRARFFERDESGHLPTVAGCEPRDRTTTCSFAVIAICSDTSHAIITVTRGATVHRIDDDHCTDDALLGELEDLILDLSGARTWIGPPDG